MARPKKAAAPKTNGHASGATIEAPAAVGHNAPPLTEEEASALTTHFALKIIADQRVAAQKKADHDSAKAVVNGHFKLVSKELGITRKDFEANVLDVLGMNEVEYRNAEAKRDRLHRLAGVKQGAQLDLIEHVLKDTVDEALDAEHDGYRAGRRAHDPIPPTILSPIFTQDWMRGYGAGQAFNGLQLARAETILARPKPGEMVAGDDPDEGEQDDGSPEALKAAAQALKDSGWAGPTEAEAEFEEADGGRTIRTPRTNGRPPAVAEA